MGRNSMVCLVQIGQTERTEGSIMSNPALEALRHHVSGAIERGEAESIEEKTVDQTEFSHDDHGNVGT